MGHARRSMNYVCSIAALFSQILPLELAFCKAAPKLAFNDGGTFKILQLADLHYGHFPEIDERTDKVIANLLAYEEPDFVALSGDMVSGFAWDGRKGWFEERWRQLTAPIAAARVPYGLVLGNHDDEADLMRQEVVDLDMKLRSQGSLTRMGPKEAIGLSNYHLDIAASRTSSAPAARIWMLDSAGLGCSWIAAGSGCVELQTIWWLNRTVRALPSVPSLAFVHVPVPEFMELWNKGLARGSKHEDVNCPMHDSGLFRAAKEMNITALYSGHDHDNNYEGVLDGVRLAYGHKTGYGSYGPPPGWGHGARVILLRRGQDAAESETWIRLENGAVLEQSRNPRFKAGRQTVCEKGPFYCNEYPFEPICNPGWKYAVAKLWQRAMGLIILALVTLACSPGLGMYLYRRKRRRELKGGTDGKGSL